MYEISRQNVSVNKVILSVLTAGPPDGEPVVILHGFPEYALSFKKQILHLAGHGYFVIAPDQRGYHLSSKPLFPKNYALPKLCQDVLGLMDHFKIKKAYLLGHDWGSIVSWQLISLYPERFLKAVITSSPHASVIRKHLFTDVSQILKSWYIFFAQIPLIPEALLKADSYEFFKRKIRESSLYGPYDESELSALQESWVKNKSMKPMLNWYRAMSKNRSKKLGGKISVPVTLLWGKCDPFVGSQMAFECAELCESCEVILFNETGHWPHHERADEINRLLLEAFCDF